MATGPATGSTDPGGSGVPAPVRRAVERDLDALAELWTALSEHHEGADPAFALRAPGATPEIRALVAAMLRDPDGAVFASADARGVAGFAAVRVDRGPPILVEDERAEITDLFVVERARRRGVGRALVASALHWVRARGLERCEVRVAAHNPEGQAFWRALGFGDLMDVLQRRL